MGGFLIMNNTVRTGLLLAATALMVSMYTPQTRAGDQNDTSKIAGHTSWGYAGDHRAAVWGHTNPDDKICKDGTQQSPVNIAQYAEQDLPDIQIDYQQTPLMVVNNGHTIKANYAPGSTITIGEHTYELMTLDFHTPSEHYFDGAPYPMELHLVHKAEDGALAVLGVMIKVGAHNEVVEGIWLNTPPNLGENKIDTIAYSAESLLPANRDYYAYEGSLTTPPCTEGVKWHVFKDPIEMSAAQLTAFQGIFPVNARPIQNLNGRIIRGD